MSDYGYTVQVPVVYDEAVIQTRMAFRGEGFSILSEMHVGGMLGPEAGDERQYLIMGMWNAAVADRHIDNDTRMATHLPCNLVIQEADDGSIVAALDPMESVEEADETMLAAGASARAALGRVLQRLSEVPG